MDQQYEVYSHEGVRYVYDSYTGITKTTVRMKAEEDDAREAYDNSPKRKAELVQRKAEMIIMAERDAKITARNAPIKAARKAKETALIDEAYEIAKSLNVTESSYEDWRIENGYLWKVVSPKGKVFTETLKSLTIDDPLYAVGHAYRLAVYKKFDKGR